MKLPLTAIVRICPYISKNQPPFFKDKFSLVKTCNNSFINAGDCERIYLLDNCPDEYEKYFKKYGEVFTNKWGKKESLYAAYDAANRRGRQNILFLEDDYLWREDTLKDVVYGLDQFGLVSPYDHPGHYEGTNPTPVIMYVIKNKTWRYCQTNTHTFAVRRDIFRNNIDGFYYGLHDWQMFFYLTTKGIKLYCPVPSFATHLVDGLLANNIDWGHYININNHD